MESKSGGNELPENAYRELKTGETYRPVMSPEYQFPEVTTWSVVWGLIMAFLFSAAAAYSGLKIGQVFEAAIPISILAVGLSTFFKRRKSLGQNVIIQSIGASSGVIVAGAIFTIPGLYILNLPVSFFQVFLSSMLGGFLGILFLIPFRRYFVKDMHGKFPFPEATATTEILITGEKGGDQAKVLIISGLIGGLYDYVITSLGWWSEVFTSRVMPYGTELATKAKMVFKLDVLSMIFGLGYIVGLRYATIICAGSLLSWFVLVPLVNQIGSIAAGPAGINPFAAMPAEQIFRDYVRHIGIGGIAMAGIIGIMKSSGIIGSAFSLAFKEIFQKKGADSEVIHRTQVDLKMTFIVLAVLLTIAAIFIFLVYGVNLNFYTAFIALLTVVIISFLFTTVAANAIAIVGTNPVSGMTLMTLILSSIILTKVGLSGPQGMMSALIIGGIVCTALSMAGGFITDLKVGYWLGSTPKKQEAFKFLGTIVSAATVGGVILILNQTYGFSPDNANPLAAPQANAMAAVIQPLMTSQAQVHWMLYIVGAVLAFLLNALKISPLAFALGMYLPQELNTPLIVGGLVAYIVQTRSKDEALNNARFQRGTLIASGFIAGGALFGVLGAIMKFAFIQFSWPDIFLKTWSETPQAAWIGLGLFAVIIAYTIYESMRAKVENNN
ncbi:MAG: oligopeptide transporter, OPT family [Bacteroidota bacterium]